MFRLLLIRPTQLSKCVSPIRVPISKINILPVAALHISHRWYTNKEKTVNDEDQEELSDAPVDDIDFNFQDEFDKVQNGVEIEKKEKKTFDWFGLEKDDELPTVGSEKGLKKEEEFWKKIEIEDQVPEGFTPPPPTQQQASMLEKMKALPLPTGPFPDDWSIEKYELQIQRQLEEMDIYLKLAKLDKVVHVFMDTRHMKLIPPREMYLNMIPILAQYVEFDTMQFLLDEMKELGYEWDERVYYALIDAAWGKSEEGEYWWNEAVKNKFEMNAMAYNKRLLYYARRTSDLEKILHIFDEMLEAGHKDINGGVIVLHLCFDNKLWSIADTIFDKMKKHGLFHIDAEKDNSLFKFDEKTAFRNIKCRPVVDAYHLMAEIYAYQGNLEKVNEVMKLAEDVQSKFGRKGSNMKYIRLYASLIELHLVREDASKAVLILEQLINEDMLPPVALFRRVFTRASELNQSRAAMKVLNEMEMYGLTLDGESYSAGIQMWQRIKDYRRAKNAWNDCITAGYQPNEHARTAMILSYEAAGSSSDVFKFWSLNVKAQHKLTSEFHEAMIRDHLKRNYPKEALPVIEIMRASKLELNQATFESVLYNLAEFGEGPIILTLIERDILSGSPTQKMTGHVISSAIIGYSYYSTQENKGLDLFDRYYTVIPFDYTTALGLIKALGRIREADSALDIYTRLKNEKLISKDSFELFETLFQLPVSRSYPISFKTHILSDMKSFNINPSINIFIAVMKQCAQQASLLDALSIMKSFTSEYYGLPFHLGFCIQFFVILSRYEYGQYRRHAVAWIKRLLPTSRNTMPWLPIIRGNDFDLESYEDQLISVPQSMNVARYVASIDPDNIITSPTRDYQSLFETSDLDLEDLLVHQYGYNRDEVRQFSDVDKFEDFFHKFTDLQTELKETQ